MKGKRMQIGISGGTFDPVHQGHLIIAEEARDKFKLDKVIFIPSGTPPHKTKEKVTAAEHRFKMVQKAIESNNNFEVSRIEIERFGYTYTIDTLLQLKKLFGEDTQLFFIIGADIVWDLTTWRDFTQVFKMCEFIAALRPGFEKTNFNNQIESLKNEYNTKIHTIDIPIVDISSTIIRKRVRNTETIKYLVPIEVEKYIHKNRLYLD